MQMYLTTIITTIVILSQAVTNAYAQEKGTNLHSYRAGDEIRKQIITYKNEGANGKDVVWDFSDVDILDKNYTVTYSSTADNKNTIVGIENKTRYYYTEHTDTLIKNGYENSTTRICYDRPEAILHYPITYGDKINGVFHGTAAYSERMMSRISGIYEIETDATGTLILPEENILYNVIRVHSRQLVGWQSLKDILTEAELQAYIDSIVPYNTDSIMTIADKDIPVMEINRYSWYATGYRYPVIETTAISDESGSPVCLTALYCPASEQELLYDEDNRIVRENIKTEKNNPNVDIDTDENKRTDELFQYKTSIEGGIIDIEYSLDKKADIKIFLCDIAGIVYKSRNIQGITGESNNINIDCNGLRHGDYILYINVNGKTYSSKVLI